MYIYVWISIIWLLTVFIYVIYNINIYRISNNNDNISSDDESDTFKSNPHYTKKELTFIKQKMKEGCDDNRIIKEYKKREVTEGFHSRTSGGIKTKIRTIKRDMEFNEDIQPKKKRKLNH